MPADADRHHDTIGTVFRTDRDPLAGPGQFNGLFPEVTKIAAASTFAGELVAQFHVGEGSDNKGRLHAETKAHFPKGPISNRHQRKVS